MLRCLQKKSKDAPSVNRQLSSNVTRVMEQVGQVTINVSRVRAQGLLVPIKRM